MRFYKLFLSFSILSVFILGSFYMPSVIAENFTPNTVPLISDDRDINFIVLWPLDENFKIVQFNISSCTPYPYLKNRLIGYYINATEALEIRANVYIGCSNVSGIKVEVLSPKITRKKENFVYVTVPVSYLQTIKENAFNFVQSVKSNPWTIKEIVEKTKLANKSDYIYDSFLFPGRCRDKYSRHNWRDGKLRGNWT